MFLLHWVGRELGRRLAAKAGLDRYLWLIVLAPLAFVLVLVLSVGLVVLFIVASQNSGGCGTTVPISAPGNIKTAVQVVQYFESQGISANGAAGITGNLDQENGFSPAFNAGGDGVAQWLGGRGTAMVTWTTQQGYPGDSPNPQVALAGQLMYIVYDLRTSYGTLLAALNSAPDPGTAATAFETIYEVCSGVTGPMQVTPGSQCNDPARRSDAATALQAAGGTTAVVQASLTTGGTCVAVGGSGGDPIPGFTPGRDDMGVDACAKPGMPILAPAQSTLVDVKPNWYAGQPLMLFQFNPPLAGAYQGDDYWYVAEEVFPASLTKGTVFGPGQPVATFAPSGSCIEIGWASPAGGQWTLAGATGRGADANPPAGALTPEAEAFKTFFHIPWVGQSP